MANVVCKIHNPRLALGTGNTAFTHPGGQHWYLVPDGVTQISVRMWGAGGAGAFASGTNGLAPTGTWTTKGTGGGGGYTEGVVAVTPGQRLKVFTGVPGMEMGQGGSGSAIMLDDDTPIMVAGGGGASGLDQEYWWDGTEARNTYGGAGGGSLSQTSERGGYYSYGVAATGTPKAIADNYNPLYGSKKSDTTGYGRNLGPSTMVGYFKYYGGYGGGYVHGNWGGQAGPPDHWRCPGGSGGCGYASEIVSLVTQLTGDHRVPANITSSAYVEGVGYGGLDTADGYAGAAGLVVITTGDTITVIPDQPATTVTVDISSASRFPAFDPYWEQTELLLKNTSDSGSTITDATGKSLTVNGTPVSAVSRWVNGGSSIYFDGTGDDILVSNSGNFILTGDFTIEAWVNLTNLTSSDSDGWGNNCVFSHGNNGSAASVQHYSLMMGGSQAGDTGKIYFGTNLGGSGVVSTTTLTTNRWYHVAVTRASGTLRIFIDGVQEASATNTTAFGNSAWSTYIGRQAYEQNRHFNGYIDDLRVTNGIARYTTSFALPSHYVDFQSTDDPCWAQTSLLLRGDGANNSVDIKDETGKTITVAGNAKISTTQSKFGGSSIYQANTATDLVYLPVETGYFPGDFTFETWVYSIGTNDASVMVFSNGSTYFAFNIAGTTITLYTNTPTPSVTISGTSLGQSTWNHVAWTRTGTTGYVFVDGTQVWTGTISGAMGYTNPTTYHGIGGGAAIQRYIADFRITKGVARYTANFAVPSSAVPYVTRRGPDFDFNDLDYHYDNNVLLLRGEGPNNGTYVYDETGKAVSVVGDAKTSTSQSMFGTSSLAFDGNGDYLSVVNNGDFNFGTSDFTIEAWIYTTDVSAERVIVGAWASWSSAIGFAFEIRSGGTLYFIAGNSAPVNISSSAGTITVNTWYHVSVSRSSGTTRLFINGVIAASTGTTANISTASNLFVGKDPSLSDLFWTGYIDNLRITKGIARYTANFTPTTRELPYDNSYLQDKYWEQTKLLIQGEGANNSTDIRDVKGNAITVNGAAKISNGQSLFGTGTSLSFDGASTSYLSVPDSTDFDFGAGDWTIEYWIRPNAVNALKFVHAKRVNATSDFKGFETYTTASATIGLAFTANNTSWAINATTTSTITANNWHHIAAVRFGSAIYVFVNGTLNNMGTFSGTIATNTAPLIIGAGGTAGSSAPFAGYLDDFRITKGVARYTSNFTPVRKRLPDHNTFDAYWERTGLKVPFNGINGSTSVSDEKGHSITLTGTAAISTTQSKFGGSSLRIPTASSMQTESSPSFAFGANDFSIEFWYYKVSDVAGATSAYIISNKGSRVTNTWALMVQGGVLSFWAVNIDGSNALLSTGSVISTSTWYHIALTRTGGTIRLFVDGVMQASYNIGTGNIDNDASNSIWLGGSSSTYYIDAYIDDLRITKGVARYTGKFPVPTAANPSEFNRTYFRPDFYDPHWNKTELLLSADGSVGSTSTYDLSYSQKAVTRYSASTPVIAYQSPHFNTSIYFDGSTNSYLSVPNTSAWNFGSGDYTIELWINTTTSSSINLWGKGTNASAYDNLFVFNINYTAGKAGLYYAPSGGSGVSLSGSTTINDGVWHHLALCRANGTTRLFVDGKVDMTTTASYTAYTSNGSNNYICILDFGPNGLSNRFTGYIDDFRITKGVARYTKQFAPLKARLPDVNDFDPYLDSVVGKLSPTGTGGVITSDDRGKTITFNGNAVVSTLVTKFSGSSVRLAGSGGSADGVSFGNYADWAFGNGDFTIEFWMNPTAWDGVNNNALVNRNGGAGATPFYMFVGPGGGSITLYVNGSQVISGSANTSINKWHHVAMSRAGSSLRVFSDGVQVGSTYNIGTTSLQTTSANLVFGNYGDSATFLRGYLGEIRITKGVGRYAAGFPALVKSFPSVPVNRYLMKTTTTASSQIKTSALVSQLGQGSVEFWVNHKTPTTYGVIYSEDTLGGTVFNFNVYPDGHIEKYTNNGSDNFFTSSVGVMIPNQWNHVVFTWASNGTHCVYINGVLDKTGSSVSSASGSIVSVVIGPASNHNTLGLVCGLKNFRIYNAPISAAQVLAQYSNGVYQRQDGGDTNLITSYNFCTAGTLIADHAGNNSFTLGSGCVINDL